MYFSGGNTTVKASLLPAGNDIIWSGRHHVILCHYERNLSAQKHLWPFNEDADSRRDNNHKCFKGATKGQQLMLTSATITTQMQHECIKGALA